LMNIFPDTVPGRLQNRGLFNPGIVIAHDQENPGIEVAHRRTQNHKILHQEIIDEILVDKTQCFRGIPTVGEKIAADEHGLRSFPGDHLKEFLVAVDPAVEIGDKKGSGHGINDNGKCR
jgi:hypothetical protein